MLLKNKTVAVVGGGPAGLTLARLLQMKGVQVKVYERDANKDVRVQGATLDLHEDSGLKALHEAGLMETFRAHYRPGAGKVRVLDKHAAILVDQHTQLNYEESRPEIDRGPLRNILLGSLLPDTLVWDCNFKSLTPIGDAWQIHFHNGFSAMADIVVAADGANSKIRPYISPIKPFYTGFMAIEGVVYDSKIAAPKVHELLKGGKIFAFGDSKSLIVSAKGDGSLAFYPGFKAEENWLQDCAIDFTNNAQVLAWFKTEYAGWNNLWDELFAQSTMQFIPRPQYCMPLDQSWAAQPNITMLGDAAHLMPPYAGEGVNVAMFDALELSLCLTNAEFPDIQTAIVQFEKQMCERASISAAMSLESMALLHSSDAIPFMSGFVA